MGERVGAKGRAQVVRRERESVGNGENRTVAHRKLRVAGGDFDHLGKRERRDNGPDEAKREALNVIVWGGGGDWSLIFGGKL